jgi:hypothetical protein
MTPTEQETIDLCIALEAIDDIVNHALLDVNPVSAFPGEVEVRFKTRVHQQMFLVRLLDFSKEARRQVGGVKKSCLEVVLDACATRSFDVDGSVDSLKASATALRDWLAACADVKMWIPTLEIDANVSVPRIQLLFILGNHVKHNLGRLTGVSAEVAKILQSHGYSVQQERVCLALDDIREHLQENYFVYYGSWLAELVNNVRWGMHDYLAPAFRAAYRRVPGHDIMYEYLYPATVVDPIAREWFWRLMNHARSTPYVHRFKAAHYMKRVSSMEKSWPQSVRPGGPEA